ncbi:MAG: EAL domain-containing protein [Alphaproteobacteria bacterium]|nr:EAL domain-containing protein [Alphaproteobacteria bacterium]
MSSYIDAVKRKHSENTDAQKVKTRAKYNNIFVSSPTQIWKSKISWRVAATAFLTIMLIQTLVLNLGGIEKYRLEQLDALKKQMQMTLTAISERADSLPFSDKNVLKLLDTTNITGLSIYDYNTNLIKAYGRQTRLIPTIERLKDTYFSDDGKTFEAVFNGSDIGVQNKFRIVAQIYAENAQSRINTFVFSSITIMFILSLLVTTVLMIALGKWLLEPMLFMKESLIIAFKNPENPDIPPSPFSPSDEIGAAIELTQKLIFQNAENINHLKVTAEDKIHKLAYYDSLTGLPNRSLFVQRLAEASKINSDGEQSHFAIVTLDLDHFKDINDSMGHNVGDAILRAVGKRLRSSMPENSMVSKMGEDEFALMAPLVRNTLTARDVAERVIGIIRAEPFKVFNEEFQVRASIGVSTFPDDGSEPDIVLKNADIALNRAKEEGRDTIKEYSEDFDRAVQERFQMLRDLRYALENEQLLLHFQPQLNLKSGKVIGAEALLRWWKPDNSKEGGSFVSPGVFIPVAEQSGLIVPIGQWVLKKTCETAAQFHDEYGMDIRFAVNVSGNQFVQSDICEDVTTALEETGINPNLLELEVTESVFMDDIKQTVQILHNLHSLGVELAIDDFGTGYSSLSYLSQFPIDRLKIDQSFVRQALNDKENASIARTIINLGHSLNLKVIAEGVESKGHEDFLIKQGCDEVQGFRYSKPVPVEELRKFIENYNGKLSTFN